MGFGHLFTVQSARSQADDSHVTNSRVSVGYTGQNLFRENYNNFSSTLAELTQMMKKVKAGVRSINELHRDSVQSGHTSEDIRALMVGPVLVFMLIFFNSSAHIVRHLRRVSGSFWSQKNKHLVNFLILSDKSTEITVLLMLCTFSVRASLSAL